MKIENQFKAVMEHSTNHIDNCFCLKIEKDKSSLIGISQNMISPQSALVLIRCDQQLYIKGNIDGITYESSSVENLNASENILLGVDCRKPDNTKIYYQSGNSLNKISSATNMEANDTVIIFWEHGDIACLTMCIFDSLQEEVIRTVVSAESIPMKKFLRAVVQQNLQFSNMGHHDVDDHDIEDFAQEDKNHESNWYWEESYE
jgi:hypothetical protein